MRWASAKADTNRPGMQAPLSAPRSVEKVVPELSFQGGLMVIAADYPFLDIMWTMFIFFAWVVWIYLLVVIFSDIFRRRDAGGWSKAGWCLFVMLLPFLGVLVYLGFQGRHMAERNAQAAAEAKSQFDTYVQDVAAQSGPSGEIANAKSLLDSGAITQVEFDQLKTKALAAA